MLETAKQEKLYKQYQSQDDTVRIDESELKKMNRPFTPLGKIFSLITIVLLIFAISRYTARSEYLYALGGMMLAWLLIKQALALFYRPSKAELTQDYKVSVILTCYNEQPSAIVSVLENILALDYPVHEVLFLDDGSKEPLAYEVAKSFAEDHKDIPNAPKFQIIRFAENRGKRAVMMDGFLKASGDYLFMLDSDCEILPNALTELLRPFEDGKTTSVVGNIGVLNRRKSILTRLQSITYFGAFQLGRAAQSVTGNVIICSGAFSLHKKEFILDHLEEFEDVKFCGIRCSSGDDRSLTALSRLSGGKTRYQNTAYCETVVPDKWKTFQKQRRRWQRSGYLGSLKAIRMMVFKRPLFSFWSFAEAYFWLIATVLFILAIRQRGFYIDIVDIVAYYIVIAYKQNIFYLFYKPLRFIIAPLYLFVYGVSLTITRIHAIVTILNDDWGTRQTKEEKAFPQVTETTDQKTVA